MTASSQESRLPPLGLTIGDPAGIGPDITLAAWQMATGSGAADAATMAAPATAQAPLASLPPFVAIGDPAVYRARAKRLGLGTPIVEVLEPAEARDVFSRALPVLKVGALAACEPGTPDPRAAPLIIAAIEEGVALIRAGRLSGLVTSPIAKAVLYEAGFAHPGHTEFLGHLAARHWGGRPEPVMMLATPELRVVPVTVHIPLSEVPRRLSRTLVERTAHITAEALLRDFGIAVPRLAIAGLNPHAGEGGTLGHEEAAIIAPAIARLKAAGLAASGPHPADSLFHEAARQSYDAVLAMYHDQALIAIKTLAFERAVNVTLGLPFVRTSPDHGTAFDIAGSGRANPQSLVAALTLAGEIAARRAGVDAP